MGHRQGRTPQGGHWGAWELQAGRPQPPASETRAEGPGETQGARESPAEVKYTKRGRDQPWVGGDREASNGRGPILCRSARFLAVAFKACMALQMTADE